jgi:hypothetical protein
VRVVGLTGIRAGDSLWVESIDSTVRPSLPGRSSIVQRPFGGVNLVTVLPPSVALTKAPRTGLPLRSVTTPSSAAAAARDNPKKRIVERHARSLYIRSILDGTTDDSAVRRQRETVF